MTPLFAYGTLSDPDLLEAVLGRPVAPPDLVPCFAPGYHAVHLPHRLYPALVERPGGAATGLLLHGLAPDERDLLDAFEGDEYRRRALLVEVEGRSVRADCYHPLVPIPDNAPDWTLVAWQRNHKAKVLVAEAAAASDIRARLAGTRPTTGLAGEPR